MCSLKGVGKCLRLIKNNFFTRHFWGLPNPRVEIEKELTESWPEMWAEAQNVEEQRCDQQISQAQFEDMELLLGRFSIFNAFLDTCTPGDFKGEAIFSLVGILLLPLLLFVRMLGSCFYYLQRAIEPLLKIRTGTRY